MLAALHTLSPPPLFRRGMCNCLTANSNSFVLNRKTFAGWENSAIRPGIRSNAYVSLIPPHTLKPKPRS
jgi:hypothetical protein